MGNRSKLVVAGAVAAAALVSRRRSRARAMAEGIAEAILPTRVGSSPELASAPDPGEAPGHRHRLRGERGETSERSRRLSRSAARERPRVVRR